MQCCVCKLLSIPYCLVLYMQNDVQTHLQDGGHGVHGRDQLDELIAQLAERSLEPAAQHLNVCRDLLESCSTPDCGQNPRILDFALIVKFRPKYAAILVRFAIKT